MFKRPASAEFDKSSKPEILNIRELMREGQAESSTFRQAESSDGETSANLRSLLGRVAETSGREVDNLIDELQRVREKLRDDGDRIQRAIEEYAKLSQQVMKLTEIISESLQKLPNASHRP